VLLLVDKSIECFLIFLAGSQSHNELELELALESNNEYIFDVKDEVGGLIGSFVSNIM
jgi:hypothetical protein